MHSTAEQVHVLLNYRYHLPIDSKGWFPVFAGPSIGFIHEKHTEINVNLGTLPANGTGETSDSDWKFVPEELELIKQSSYRGFPPRLPEQPIFYPVLVRCPVRRELSFSREHAVPCQGYYKNWFPQKSFSKQRPITA